MITRSYSKNKCYLVTVTLVVLDIVGKCSSENGLLLLVHPPYVLLGRVSRLGF